MKITLQITIKVTPDTQSTHDPLRKIKKQVSI